MTYLNEYHKTTVERKLSAMQEMQKSPIDCKAAIQQMYRNLRGY